MITNKFTLTAQPQVISKYPAPGVEIRIHNVGQAEVVIGGPQLTLADGWPLAPNEFIKLILDDTFPVMALSGNGSGLNGGSLLPALDNEYWSVEVDNSAGGGSWVPGEYEYVMNYESTDLGITYESLATQPQTLLITSFTNVLIFVINANTAGVAPYPTNVDLYKLYVRPVGALTPFVFVSAAFAPGDLITVPTKGNSPDTAPTSASQGVGVIKVIEAV